MVKGSKKMLKGSKKFLKRSKKSPEGKVTPLGYRKSHYKLYAWKLLYLKYSVYICLISCVSWKFFSVSLLTIQIECLCWLSRFFRWVLFVLAHDKFV